MFKDAQYHELIRKTVVAFGTLFNDLYVYRKNSTGKTIQKMKVPLAYGPKQKFLTRKLNRIQKFKKVKGADTKSLQNSYMPVPYNVGFSLFVMAKNSEDALQIVEQILPTFQPDYTITLNVMPTLEVVRDVPIVLGDVSYEDSYDGEFTERRVIMYTLSFTAKMYLYGPVTSQKIIKRVQVDQYTDTNTAVAKREQRYVVQPNPTTADADDNFGFD